MEDELIFTLRCGIHWHLLCIFTCHPEPKAKDLKERVYEVYFVPKCFLLTLQSFAEPIARMSELKNQAVVVPGQQLMLLKYFNPPSSKTAYPMAYADSDLPDLKENCYYTLYPSPDFTVDNSYAVDINSDSIWTFSGYYKSQKLISRRIGEESIQCYDLPLAASAGMFDRYKTSRYSFHAARLELTRIAPDKQSIQTLTIYGNSSKGIRKCLEHQNFAIKRDHVALNQ